MRRKGECSKQQASYSRRNSLFVIRGDIELDDVKDVC